MPDELKAHHDCPFCGAPTAKNGDCAHDVKCWVSLLVTRKLTESGIGEKAWNTRATEDALRERLKEAVGLSRDAAHDDQTLSDGGLVLDHRRIDAFLARIGEV